MAASTSETMALSGDGTMSDEDHATINLAKETKYKFALPYLMKNVGAADIPPLLYLTASGEGVFTLLLISWIITFIFSPETITDNPLLTRLGYNNLCVGWDVAPANYLAVVCWVFVAYLAIRFTAINEIRYQMEPPSKLLLFGRVSNWLFFLAVCIFTLCLVIPPTRSVWYHTIPFIGFIITRFLILVALCLEDWENTLWKTRVFLIINGILSASLPVIYLSEYAYYAAYGVRSPWPYQITVVMDYSWFLCVAVTGKFIPSNLVLRRSFELVQLDEHGSIKRVTRLKTIASH